MGKYIYIGGGIEQTVKKYIRDVPGFPRPPIVFKDITPLLQDGPTFKRVIDHLTERYTGKGIDVVVGIESRGFIFGAPLAYNLGIGYGLARKKGKLPYDTVEVSYNLEYGTGTIEMHTDAIRKGQRVLIVDDLLATGGTASATCHLVEKLGGEVAECVFVVELGFLNGRELLKQYDVCTLARYE